MIPTDLTISHFYLLIEGISWVIVLSQRQTKENYNLLGNTDTNSDWHSYNIPESYAALLITWVCSYGIRSHINSVENCWWCLRFCTGAAALSPESSLASSALWKVSSSKQLSPQRGWLPLSELSESLCDLILGYNVCCPSWALDPVK